MSKNVLPILSLLFSLLPVGALAQLQSHALHAPPAPVMDAAFAANVDLPPGIAAITTAVFEGDSLTSGSGLVKAAQNTPSCVTSLADAGCLDWPSQLLLMSALSPRIKTKANLAVGGSTIAMVQARYPAVHALSPAVTGKPGILFVKMGINDISTGLNPVVTIEAAIASYWATAKADGWRLAAFTTPPDALLIDEAVIGPQTILFAVNDWIRSRAGISYDYLVDSDRLLGDPHNLTWYQSDGLHPTAAGHYAEARAVNAALWTDGTTAPLANFNALPGNLKIFGGVLSGPGDYTPGNPISLTMNSALGSTLAYAGTQSKLLFNHIAFSTNFVDRVFIDTTFQIIAGSVDPVCTATGHLGRIWIDNTVAANTAYKVCLNVAGVPAWVTK